MSRRGQAEYIIQEPTCVYALPHSCIATHSSHDRDAHYRGRLNCSVLNERKCPTVRYLRTLLCLRSLVELRCLYFPIAMNFNDYFEFVRSWMHGHTLQPL